MPWQPKFDELPFSLSSSLLASISTAWRRTKYSKFSVGEIQREGKGDSGYLKDRGRGCFCFQYFSQKEYIIKYSTISTSHPKKKSKLHRIVFVPLGSFVGSGRLFPPLNLWVTTWVFTYSPKYVGSSIGHDSFRDWIRLVHPFHMLVSKKLQGY